MHGLRDTRGAQHVAIVVDRQHTVADDHRGGAGLLREGAQRVPGDPPIVNGPDERLRRALVGRPL